MFHKLVSNSRVQITGKSLLIGIFLGLPIVLSFSGHFLLFWSRTNEFRYLILLGLLAVTGVLIGLLINKSMTKAKLTQEIAAFFLLPCIILAFGLIYRSRIPLPLLPSTLYNMTLTISGEDTDAESYSKTMVGIRMIAQKGNRTVPFLKISCDGTLIKSERNVYFFELASDRKLQCSFWGNTRDAIKFTFLRPHYDGEDVEVILNSEAGRATKETFHVNYSNKDTENFGVLLPHTYFSIFCLALDIISLAIIFSFPINLFFILHPENTKLFIKKVFVLPPVVTIMYLMVYPYFSGYIVGKDRTDFQLNRLPDFERIVRDVDRYVPENASMAIIFPGKYPVSPLFGPDYSRRLLPQYPAPESISADYLHNLGADYLLMSADLFEKDNLETDGQLHFVIYGGGEVVYPIYSLYSMLESGLIIVASCVKQPDCSVRYYIFSAQR